MKSDENYRRGHLLASFPEELYLMSRASCRPLMKSGEVLAILKKGRIGKDMSFFSPNIGTQGRLFRGLMAVVFFALASWVFWMGGSWWWIVVLSLGGLFTAIEAVRGWCVARACGIKTKV